MDLFDNNDKRNIPLCCKLLCKINFQQWENVYSKSTIGKEHFVLEHLGKETFCTKQFFKHHNILIINTYNNVTIRFFVQFSIGMNVITQS